MYQNILITNSGAPPEFHLTTDFLMSSALTLVPNDITRTGRQLSNFGMCSIHFAVEGSVICVGGGCVCAFTSLVVGGVVPRLVGRRLPGRTPPDVPVDVRVPAVAVAAQVVLLKVTLWWGAQRRETSFLCEHQSRNM